MPLWSQTNKQSKKPSWDSIFISWCTIRYIRCWIQYCIRYMNKDEQIVSCSAGITRNSFIHCFTCINRIILPVHTNSTFYASRASFVCVIDQMVYNIRLTFHLHTVGHLGLMQSLGDLRINKNLWEKPRSRLALNYL